MTTPEDYFQSCRHNTKRFELSSHKSNSRIRRKPCPTHQEPFRNAAISSHEPPRLPTSVQFDQSFNNGRNDCSNWTDSIVWHLRPTDVVTLRILTVRGWPTVDFDRVSTGWQQTGSWCFRCGDMLSWLITTVRSGEPVLFSAVGQTGDGDHSGRPLPVCCRLGAWKRVAIRRTVGIYRKPRHTYTHSLETDPKCHRQLWATIGNWSKTTGSTSRPNSIGLRLRTTEMNIPCPLLFILYATPLSTVISNSAANHHLYADDIYSTSLIILSSGYLS